MAAVQTRKPKIPRNLPRSKEEREKAWKDHKAVFLLYLREDCRFKEFAKDFEWIAAMYARAYRNQPLGLVVERLNKFDKLMSEYSQVEKLRELSADPNYNKWDYLARDFGLSVVFVKGVLKNIHPELFPRK